jgi:uncharacterized repeat protein (TIGR03803 family)
MRVFVIPVLSVGVFLASCSPQAMSSLGEPHVVPAQPRSGVEIARQSLAPYGVVYNFRSNPDGAGPLGNLAAVNGQLYGVTGGGGNNLGTVFGLTRSGKERVLHRFTGGADGWPPAAGLADVSGTLYGITSSGGTGCPSVGGCGTIFKISTTGAEQVLYSFTGAPDGRFPNGGLIGVNGVLYGTTEWGGTSGCYYGCGVVFSINTDGTGYKVLYRFRGGKDGGDPSARLVDLNGEFYGTTATGGTGSCIGGCGTVFGLSPSGREHVIYAFKGGRDGVEPKAGLIAANGTLYGTTLSGGSTSCGGHGCGTVFTVSTSGAERVLYGFKGGYNDGANPATELSSLNGLLYGTTASGGACGCGTIFDLDASGTEKIVHSFGSGSDGVGPNSALLDLGGMLYGATYAGGSGKKCGLGVGCGTIFRLTQHL